MFKKLTAFTLSVLMIAALCVTSVFAAYNASLLDKGEPVEDYDVVDGVNYRGYNVRGGMEDDSIKYSASMLTFDSDEYIPVVYSCFAGNAAVLSTQYQYAVNKDGYEVAAVINGSFFSMDTGKLGNYGILNGITISDGKINSAHAGYQHSVVVFDSLGNMNIIDSKLDYKLYIGGQLVPNGIYYINKHSGENGSWSDKFYYYDTDCGTVADTASRHPGYEVICEKVDGTELVVGGTLRGKVLEVRENSYGAAIGDDYYKTSNKFVLFCTASSSYARFVKDLEVGASIEISADESIEESKEIMRNANSLIENVGWLVKDGVDQTEKVASIGSHSVTLTARWTAFGTKPDGTYVFFTSEGGSTGQKALTLKDVAKLMLAEGCTNVIRMDGGGSSAMYVSDTGNGEAGYKQASSRSVGDCIMVVKRSSMQDETIKSNLENAIEDAKAALLENENTAVRDAVEAAEKLLSEGKPVNGDYIKAYMKILDANSGTKELDELITASESIKPSDYTLSTIKELWAARDNAIAVRSSDTATVNDYAAACEVLRSALENHGTYTNISKGTTYTYSAAPNPAYSDKNKTKLTDGVEGDINNAKESTWIGVSSADVWDVVVDLGKITTNVAHFSMDFLQLTSWGINLPVSVEFATSIDGVNFTSAGIVAPEIDRTRASDALVYELNCNGVTARYVKATVTRFKSFVFFSEFVIGRQENKLDDSLYATDFNTSIVTGASTIFTRDYDKVNENGELLSTDANFNWVQATVFEPTEDGGYKVIKKYSNPKGETCTIPEGGFILATHVSDLGDNPEFDKQTYANRLKNENLVIGDVVNLYGIDLEELSMAPGAFILKAHVHAAAGDWVVIKEATEEEEGSRIKICDCGEIVGTEAIPKLEHVLGEWVITKAATKDEEGERVRKCVNCGEVIDKEIIPKLQDEAPVYEIVDEDIVISAEKLTVEVISETVTGEITIKNASGKALSGTDAVGTGCVVIIGEKEYTVVITGDIDGDGIVTTKDYVMVKRIFMKTLTVNDTAVKAADIDGDGSVSTKDYVFVKRHVIGTLNIFTK